MLIASQAEKRSYNDAFKLKVVEDAKKATDRAAARKFKAYMHAVTIL